MGTGGSDRVLDAGRGGVRPAGEQVRGDAAGFRCAAEVLRAGGPVPAAGGRAPGGGGFRGGGGGGGGRGVRRRQPYISAGGRKHRGESGGPPELERDARRG